MKGTSLRRAREMAGITQAALAQACGVEQSTVSRWEKSDKAIPPGNESAVFKLLGASDDPGVVGGYVDSHDELREWKMRVAEREKDKDMRLILIVLDTWLDTSSWVVSVTREEIIDLLGGGDGHIDRALRSAWVDRLGRVEFALRLRFPV